MLKQIQKSKSRDKRVGAFAIVASQYNARFVDSMVRAAQAGIETSARARRVDISPKTVHF